MDNAEENIKTNCKALSIFIFKSIYLREYKNIVSHLALFCNSFTALNKGAESLRIQIKQEFFRNLMKKIWILSAKHLWGLLDLEQKSSADER